MVNPKYDDEIDLIEIIQIFSKHRIKYLIMGFLGLAVSLIMTFGHKPLYKTNFNFTLSHPILNNDFLNNSLILKKTLNDSSLNPNHLPYLTFNKKHQIFSVIYDTSDIRKSIESLFNEAITQEITNLKSTALKTRGYDEKKTFIINGKNDDINLINFTNNDLANLNHQEVVNTLKLSFSEKQSIYPSPFKHGFIGLFTGIFLGLIWMFLSILFSKYKLRQAQQKS